jgi:signal transduction histidine kinase/ActR/RegA family two-component response regulator
MIFIGLLLTWSIVYLSDQSVNTPLLQIVFMIILSSFYLLGTRWGVFYAFFTSLPIIINILTGHFLIDIGMEKEVLVSPGYEIIVILNFVTLIVTIYLFNRAFIENIKEKEVLNLQLQVAVKEANQAAKSKSDFLSIMSHELRTPLNSVLGMTNMFLDDPKGSERKENLEILKFSALTLNSLINDVLDFDKLGSNKVQLEALSINLYKLVNDVCSSLSLTAKEKKIDLIITIDESLKNQYVITDPIRITQVIYNLVGNALKFTAKGSVSVCLNVLKREDEIINIKFSVVDTGIGINADQQELIFEAFNQASASTTRNFGGTGLGLTIVKKVLLLFNSDIQLESLEGSGSTFFFEIPFKLDHKPVIEQEEIREIDYDLSHLRVLAAEDNAINRLLLKKIFGRWNNELIFVENGEEAIKKASEEVFDVILMDMYMPLIDGYTAARAIRNLPEPYKNVYIIACTASVSNNLFDDIKAAGMNDYICKPFNTEELYSKLNSNKLSEVRGIGISAAFSPVD